MSAKKKYDEKKNQKEHNINSTWVTTSELEEEYKLETGTVSRIWGQIWQPNSRPYQIRGNSWEKDYYNKALIVPLIEAALREKHPLLRFTK